MAALRLRYDEDTLWDLVWLLLGGPAMITGFTVGAQHGDKGLMIGTPLIILLIAYVTRDTLITAHERTSMFDRLKKPEHTLLLTVHDSQDPALTGTLEVISRNKASFRRGSRLSILSISQPRHNRPARARVFIDGRSSAGTVEVQSGEFSKDQVVVIDSTCNA